MTATVDSARNTIAEIPLGAIAPSPLNPRRTFDEAALAELAASIREVGLLQPIVIRPDEATSREYGHGLDTFYVVVAGERRYRAAKLAGLTHIPAIIREDLDDVAHLRLAIVENLQRVDLDPIEEAEGYAALNRVAGMRQREIAQAVNRSQPAIANSMRLLELPEDVRELIRGGQLSVSHGVALCRFKEFPALVSWLAAAAVERNWTSHHLESKGLFNQAGYQIERAGLLTEFDYQTAFDKTICQQCPFNAYRKGEYGPGYCLKPAHYQELQTAALAARQAAILEQVTAAGQDAAALPKLSDLAYDAYECIGDRCPPGCTTACPCRAAAMGHGGRVEVICTNPKRFHSLQAQQIKTAKQAQRDILKVRLADLERAIEQVQTIGSRELAILITAVVRAISKPTCITAAAERWAAGALDGQAMTSWNARDQLVTKLVDVPPLDLVRLGVEALLRYELTERYDGYGSATTRTDWYLGEPAAPTPAEASADDDLVVCDVCTDPTPLEDAIEFDEDGRHWAMCVECYEAEALSAVECGEHWDPAGHGVPMGEAVPA